MEMTARVAWPDELTDLACRVSRDPEGRWVLAVDDAPAEAELRVRITVEDADGLGSQWTPLDPDVSVTGSGSAQDPLMLTMIAPPAGEERVVTAQGLPGPIVLVVRVCALSAPAATAAAEPQGDTQTPAADAPPPPTAPAPPPPAQLAPPPAPPASPAAAVAAAEPAPSVAGGERPSSDPQLGAAAAVVRARPGVPIGWVALGAAAMVAVAVLLWSVTRPALQADPPPPPPAPAVESATVPDVTGTPWEDGRRELEREGLRAFRAENRNDDAAEGTIIAQEPPAGRTLETGSRVALVVSLGPPTVNVPDVIGMSLSDAQDALEAAGGLYGVRDDTRPSESYDRGVVMAQSPEPGRRVAPGSTVSLTTSDGPPPPAPPPPSPPPSGLTMFTNSDQGYSVGYPTGWRVERSSYQDGGTYHRVEFIAPAENVRALVDSGPPGNSDDPLDSWRYLSRQKAREYGSRYHLISLDYATLGGYRAGYWEFDLDLESGTTVRKIDVGIDLSGQGYAVLCQAPVEDFAAYEDVFQEIIDSFQVR